MQNLCIFNSPGHFVTSLPRHCDCDNRNELKNG